MDTVLTIRTADRQVATELKDFIEQRFEDHVNCTWWEGAWEVCIAEEDEEIGDLCEELRRTDNFNEGKFTYHAEIAEF